MEQNRQTAFNIFQFRAEGITNRDAPTLYALTPERHLRELWEDKAGAVDTSPEPDENLFTLNAIPVLEDQLFAGLPLKFGSFFCQNKAMPFIRAELGLANFDKGTLAKLVSLDAQVHQALADGTLPLRGGRVPERFWVELQHMMIASGLSKAYFASTQDGKTVNYTRVIYDDVFASNHVAECIQFWDHVRRGVRPRGAEVIATESLELHLPPQEQFL